MIDIKKYLDFEKIKPLAIAAICFAAVFTTGYGVGKSAGSGVAANAPAKRSLSNYTTNTADKPKNQGENVANNTTPPADRGDCYIKGSKSKTYHIPGGAFYERTNPAACFASEEEAQAAGYKKSSR